MTGMVHPQEDDTLNTKFQDTKEFKFRQRLRKEIDRSGFTSAQKRVLSAFVNHWFVHRHKGNVHPGRNALAKRADASIKTVSRALSLFRSLEIIEATDCLHGGSGGDATVYLLHDGNLSVFCKMTKKQLRRHISENVPPILGGSNVPGQTRDKMSHRNISYNDKDAFTNDETVTSFGDNVIPFPTRHRPRQEPLPVIDLDKGKGQ